jgi:hypothetical protein
MIFDSHPSRGDIDMVRELRLHNIDALTIVPNSSGVAQPLDLCSNGRLKAAINKETGWIGKCGAEEYRKEVVKRIEDGLFACLFPSTVRVGFDLSGYLEGKVEN